MHRGSAAVANAQLLNQTGRASATPCAFVMKPPSPHPQTHLLDVVLAQCLLHNGVKPGGTRINKVEHTWHAMLPVLQAALEGFECPGHVLEPPHAQRHQPVPQEGRQAVVVGVGLTHLPGMRVLGRERRGGAKRVDHPCRRRCNWRESGRGGVAATDSGAHLLNVLKRSMFRLVGVPEVSRRSGLDFELGVIAAAEGS